MPFEAMCGPVTDHHVKLVGPAAVHATHTCGNVISSLWYTLIINIDEGDHTKTIALLMRLLE